jgi:16S rRNA (guanine(966)-N(2))-methyltransferase RsmD
MAGVARVAAVRVIAGRARGRRLSAVPGAGTRPITDRAKEALFGILRHDVVGARVLDLFAGTGGVGIEALSRGAARCDFVERDPRALRTLRANLDHTGLAAGAGVHRADVFAFLRAAPAAPYDLVYVAPPQYHGLWRQTLDLLDARPGWVASDGMVVVQIHPREEEPLALSHLAAVDRRRYGSVLLLFLARADGPRPGGSPAAPGAGAGATPADAPA